MDSEPKPAYCPVHSSPLLEHGRCRWCSIASPDTRPDPDWDLTPEDVLFLQSIPIDPK